MTMFREFFTFELKFRFKSLSTYVYFAVWFAFSFLDIAAEGFGPIGSSNGKVLLNGPYANIYNDIGISFFGIIVIAAIFGTSILRDFQRDTVQILFTKPISKVAYLGGRWAGSFVATVFAFSGLLFGESEDRGDVYKRQLHSAAKACLGTAALSAGTGNPPSAM